MPTLMKTSSMRLLLLLCLAAIAFFSALSYTKSEPFFIDALGDVPIMDALSIVDDSETTLDLPEGRIVEVFATGAVSKEELSAFYHANLPNLGWLEQSPLAYQRSGENLEIDTFYAQEQGIMTVRFTLSPAE